MINNRYFSLIKNEETNEADINIFGDITSWDWEEFGEMSAHTLSKQLEELGDVNTINVHISSYGGEVKEGLAIYNALKNHKAKIRTYCDGFACSIASVIFMAGDERIMSKASLLMIHNAWIYAAGNASELRKQAEDLDKITQASINAYMEHINISEEELKALLDAESWLTYDECLDMGFATSVTSESGADKASQSVKQSIIKLILQSKKEDVEEVDDNNDDDEENIDINTDDNSESDNDEENLENNEEEENDEEKANARVIAFLNAMIKGGMKE